MMPIDLFVLIGLSLSKITLLFVLWPRYVRFLFRIIDHFEHDGNRKHQQDMNKLSHRVPTHQSQQP
jgi:hypothetical protein